MDPWSWLKQFIGNAFGGGKFVSPWSAFGIADAAKQTNNDVLVDILLNHAPEDPIGAQGKVALGDLQLTPEQWTYLTNLISNQNTKNDQEFQEHMRDTNLESAGAQLESLGLSSSGVLQTGAISSGVSSSAADVAKGNVSLEKFNQRMSLAKQLLSMTSSMASAGLYGHALGTAKHAAGVVTAAASHSAIKAAHSRIRNEKPTMTRDQILKSLENPDESQY